MLRAHHFSKEQGPCAAKQKIEQVMLEATKVVASSPYNWSELGTLVGIES